MFTGVKYRLQQILKIPKRVATSTKNSLKKFLLSLTRGMCETSSYVTPDLVMISWNRLKILNKHKEKALLAISGVSRKNKVKETDQIIPDKSKISKTF